MAHKDKNSVVTVTETGDGVDIQWTASHPRTGERHTLLCASVTAHNPNDSLYKRGRKKVVAL